MDSNQVHHRIEELVNAEKELRASTAEQVGHAARAEELKGIEVQLDQCWDLLRQRQARIHAGESPDGAAVRSASEVEGYKQ